MNDRERQLRNHIIAMRRRRMTNQQIANELGIPRSLVSRLTGSEQLYGRSLSAA